MNICGLMEYGYPNYSVDSLTLIFVPACHSTYHTYGYIHLPTFPHQFFTGSILYGPFNLPSSSYKFVRVKGNWDLIGVVFTGCSEKLQSHK